MQLSCPRLAVSPRRSPALTQLITRCVKSGRPLMSGEGEGRVVQWTIKQHSTTDKAGSTTAIAGATGAAANADTKAVPGGNAACTAGPPFGPVTATSLHHDLRAIGLRPGMVVIVHSSLSKLGWVVGGPVSVVHALEAAIGLRPQPVSNQFTSASASAAPHGTGTATAAAAAVSTGAVAAAVPADAAASPAVATDSKQAPKTDSAAAPALTAAVASGSAAPAAAATAATAAAAADAAVGTLVMPAHTSDNSDPSYWAHPPVPAAWWALVRSEMPPFDVDRTPTRGMGRIAETFRTGRQTVRSAHPAVSFSAAGPLARTITGNHGVAYALGETSPLARVYDANGYVLLLGVTHQNNTSLHLAEYRANWYPKKTIRQGGAMFDPKTGAPVWCEFDDVEADDSDFEAIGTAFAAAHPEHVRTGSVGYGTAILLRQRPFIDFSVGWMNANRTKERFDAQKAAPSASDAFAAKAGAK